MSLVGVPLSRVPLTAVPQRTALSHAFGGIAAGLVGTAEYYLRLAEGPEWLTPFRMVALIVEIILGYLTFTGSIMAAGKLQEVKWVPQRPVTYPLQNVINLVLFLGTLVLAGAMTLNPTAAWAPFVFPVIIVLALAFGVLLIIPIGGADMPTVIAILNSYAGLSAVAMGFVLDSKLLITAGALDGSSRPDPRHHHVQGDEPFVHQRAVRRLWTGAASRRQAASRRSTSRKPPKAPRRCSSRRASS